MKYYNCITHKHVALAHAFTHMCTSMHTHNARACARARMQTQIIYGSNNAWSMDAPRISLEGRVFLIYKGFSWCECEGWGVGEK